MWFWSKRLLRITGGSEFYEVVGLNTVDRRRARVENSRNP